MLALFLSLFLWVPLASATTAELRVLTYNIKGLPAVFAEGYSEERYAEIGRILAERRLAGDAPDLVFLQESFVARTKELRDRAGYPFEAKGPDSSALLGVDSGLYILSRFPVLATKTRAFGVDVCAGWDCYANKGVQFARIQLPGLPVPLDVYNTHMQASRDHDGVRSRQVELIAEFVRETHDPRYPILFAGDFNFRPQLNEASYREFVKRTGLVNSAEFCEAKTCARNGLGGVWRSIVDHHFVSVAEHALFRLLPLGLQRSFAGEVKGMRLSDHQGLEGTYRIEWTEVGKRSLASVEKKKKTK